MGCVGTTFSRSEPADVTRHLSDRPPRTRNRAAVALRAHKEILLFQRWLKLLSPAERRIRYADGTACMTKHNREGRRCVITQNSAAERPADRGIFIYVRFPFLPAREAQPHDCGSRGRLVQSENN